jgi:hypothetical protein
MNKCNWLTKIFWKPKRIFTDLDINLVGDRYYYFNNNKTKEDDDGIEIDMKSGKKALLRVFDCEDPSDPGDQHFYSVEFVKYLN